MTIRQHGSNTIGPVLSNDITYDNQSAWIQTPEALYCLTDLYQSAWILHQRPGIFSYS